MKTTLEIPDELFRRAKATAALRGIPLRQLVSEALGEKLSAAQKSQDEKTSPPWMAGFGGLADLGDENQRINELIAEEFAKLEREDLL